MIHSEEDQSPADAGMVAHRDKLKQLARDLIERFTCSCYTEDLALGLCPCGGDGRTEDGGPGVDEGCFVCQANAALAEGADA